MLRAGIVGCGGVSRAHMQVYSILKKDVSIVAVCDTELNKSKAFADQFRIGASFTDHQDMLEESTLDFVDICTPTSTHSSIAVDAAKKGVSVLVEKPMARSTEQCRTMIEQAERSKVSLCVCHNKILSEPLTELQTILKERDLKITLCSIRSRTNQRNQKPWARRKEEGGVLWELGCHSAYFLRELLGEIDTVFATSNLVRGPADDNIYVFLRSKSGTLCSMDVSWWPTYAEEYMCNMDTETGEHVSLDLETDYFSIVKPRDLNMPVVDFSSKILADLQKFCRMRFGYAMKYLSRGRWAFIRRTHLALIREYIVSLNNHSTPPVTGEDGLATIKILEAIERSIQENQPIRV